MQNSEAELTLNVIVDDYCPKEGFLGEHGCSIHLSTPEATVLFDTGQGGVFRHNVEKLELQDKVPQAVVLSHGHSDHAGGLQLLTETFPVPLKVYLHPDAFSERFKLIDENKSLSTGIPFGQQQLEELGIEFRIITQPTEVAPGIWATGEIPRPLVQPKKLTHYLMNEAGEKQADPFLDDQALAVETKKGIVVVLGCAHAGVKPTLEHIRGFLPGRPIYAVVGGMHLLRSDDDKVLQIADYLNELDVKVVAASHCTGIPQEVLLSRNVKGEFVFLGVGSRLVF